MEHPGHQNKKLKLAKNFYGNQKKQKSLKMDQPGPPQPDLCLKKFIILSSNVFPSVTFQVLWYSNFMPSFGKI